MSCKVKNKNIVGGNICTGNTVPAIFPGKNWNPPTNGTIKSYIYIKCPENKRLKTYERTFVRDHDPLALILKLPNCLLFYIGSLHHQQ